MGFGSPFLSFSFMFSFSPDSLLVSPRIFSILFLLKLLVLHHIFRGICELDQVLTCVLTKGKAGTYSIWLVTDTVL